MYRRVGFSPPGALLSLNKGGLKPTLVKLARISVHLAVGFDQPDASYLNVR